MEKRCLAFCINDLTELICNLQKKNKQDPGNLCETGIFGFNENQKIETDTLTKSTDAQKGTELSDQTSITLQDFLDLSDVKKCYLEKPNMTEEMYSGAWLQSELCGQVPKASQAFFKDFDKEASATAVESYEMHLEETLEGSEFSEQATITIKEFLDACNANVNTGREIDQSVKSTDLVQQVSMEAIGPTTLEDIICAVQPTASLEDILNSHVATDLCSALQASYSSKSLFVMPIISS
eukprot:c24658_g1_i1 orf=331-1044(-)